MLKTILDSLRAGVVTTRYPDEPAQPPPRFRGAPELKAGRRFASLPPPAICPSGAITARSGPEAEPPGSIGRDDAYAIDLARCIFCGRCGGQGPDAAIEIGHTFELAARRRESLVDSARSENGSIVVTEALAGEHDRVAARIHEALGRSLQLRHLDAGSCNACDWELSALLNPVYDVRRLGVDFVASPRHADGVIVTGPVTRNLELAVQRTYEAVPEPRIVIAVGACACSGGIVGQSYASAGGVAEVLPVDVFVPGCPPRPEAIVFGILVAVGRLEARRK